MPTTKKIPARDLKEGQRIVWPNNEVSTVREIETPKVEVYLSMDQYPLSFPADEQITVFDEVPETVHTDVADLESGMRIVLDRQVCTISQVHDAPEGTMVLCEGERFPICLAVPTVPVVI